MKVKYETISLFIIVILVMKSMLINSVYFPLPGIFETIIEFLCFGYIVFINFTKFINNKKTLLIFFVLTILTVLTGIITNQMVIFSSFLVICLCQTIENKEKIVKVIFKTLFMILIIHLIIFVLNNTINIIYGREIRYALGFSHFNICGQFTLWCFCAYTYLNREHKKKILLGLSLVFLIYLFTKTRTMLLCSVLLVTLVFLKRFKNIIKIISENIFWIILILIIMLLIMYNTNINPDLIYKIDKWSSYRLSFSALAINEYGFTIFGQDIEYSTLPTLFIDNYNLGLLTMDVTYVGFLYNFGIIYLPMLILLCKNIAKQNTTIVQILIIVWCVFAIFEESSLNFIICFPFLFKNTMIGGKNNDT